MLVKDPDGNIHEASDEERAALARAGFRFRE